MKVSQSFTKFHKVMLFSVFLLASCQKDTKTPLSLAGTEASTELRTPCPGYDPSGCTSATKTYTFYYDGCPIDVWITVYYCPGGIYIAPPVWTMQSHPRCRALRQKLSDLYNDIGESAVVDEWNAIEKFISLSAETDILNTSESVLGENKYPCSGIGGNPCATLGAYSITASQPDCIRMCATKVFDEDGNYIWEISSIICGQACCYRYTPFCIKQDGTVCKGTSTIYQVSPCTQVGTPGTCPSPGIGGNICSPGCDRL
jgi:hypothetical protein